MPDVDERDTSSVNRVRHSLTCVASRIRTHIPDCRWISLLDLYPIYAEERDYILSKPDAYEDLANRFEEQGIPMYVDPGRKRITL